MISLIVTPFGVLFFGAICFFGLTYLLCRVQSRLEHACLAEHPPITHVKAEWTLGFFKFLRCGVLALGAIEAAIRLEGTSVYVPFGVILYLLGVTLRLAAISTLGPMWSFHVTRYAGHYRVSTGLYRYMKHPAYLGNIYITGLLLVIGAPLAAVLSVAFIIAFLVIRVHFERKILHDLEA